MNKLQNLPIHTQEHLPGVRDTKSSSIGTVRVGDSRVIHDVIQNEIHDPESPLNQA